MSYQLTAVITFIIILTFLAILFWLRRGGQIYIRPLPTISALQDQVGQAIESGRQLHISLGRAEITNRASQSSLAALQILTYLARDSAVSNVPPQVMVGAGTLLPTAQDKLNRAYRLAQPNQAFRPGTAVFVSHTADGMSYAAAVAEEIGHSDSGNLVLVGHFGSEIVLLNNPITHNGISSVMGSDSPEGLAVATAISPNVLVGEEFMAAAAYLEGRPTQLAGLQLQDILRWLIILSILGQAVYQMVQ